jgi:hypothetical protein
VTRMTDRGRSRSSAPSWSIGASRHSEYSETQRCSPRRFDPSYRAPPRAPALRAVLREKHCGSIAACAAASTSELRSDLERLARIRSIARPGDQKDRSARRRTWCVELFVDHERVPPAVASTAGGTRPLAALSQLLYCVIVFFDRRE